MATKKQTIERQYELITETRLHLRTSWSEADRLGQLVIHGAPTRNGTFMFCQNSLYITCYRVWSIPLQKKCFPNLIIFFWISTTCWQTYPPVSSGVKRGVNYCVKSGVKTCVKTCVKTVWKPVWKPMWNLWKPKWKLVWKLGWKLGWKRCEHCVKIMAVCFFATHGVFCLQKQKTNRG